MDIIYVFLLTSLSLTSTIVSDMLENNTEIMWKWKLERFELSSLVWLVHCLRGYGRKLWVKVRWEQDEYYGLFYTFVINLRKIITPGVRLSDNSNWSRTVISILTPTVVIVDSISWNLIGTVSQGCITYSGTYKYPKTVEDLYCCQDEFQFLLECCGMLIPRLESIILPFFAT